MMKEDKRNWEKEYNDILLGYKNTKDSVMVDYYEKKFFELCDNIYFIKWLIENDILVLMENEKKNLQKH